MSSVAHEGSNARAPRASALMVAAASAWCRVQVQAAVFARNAGHPRLARLVDSAQWLTDGMFAQSLTGAEKSRLTVRIYEATPAYRDVSTGLTAEEELVFARRLPSAPARILVGASGTGREALVLASRGFDVWALEPAVEPAAECRRRLGGLARVLTLSYEQMSHLVLDDSALPAAEADALHHQRFDAILLGCGSLSHVLERHAQRRLFQALGRLCPSGPIVASFLWAADEGEAAAGRPQPGRSARLGLRIGRSIARLRGLATDGRARLNYRTHRGFAYTFTRREVEELAHLAGRRVLWERRAVGPSQYATFVPATAIA
jgi:hypothetical protein